MVFCQLLIRLQLKQVESIDLTHCVSYPFYIARPVNLRKFMEYSINNPALTLLMKHLVIGQRLKTPNFSAFHWSPRGCLVSIGQHFVATRVVHLPKITETSLITESDQSGPYHQLLQLCTVRTTWSDPDQAVRAVHGCKSWLGVTLLIRAPDKRGY